MITKTHPYTYRKCDPKMIAEMLLQCIAQVQHYAQTQGFLLSGDLPSAQALHAALQAATPTLRKRLLKRAERLQTKPRLRMANQFLHLLCTRLLAYGTDAQIVRVELSEKEAAIRSARKAFVKARNEAEALRLAYLAEKGDFYKRAL